MRSTKHGPHGHVAALLLLAACGVTEAGREIGAGGGIQVARQWECDQQDERVVCQSAAFSAEDEPGAYACEPGDEASACPPASALADLEDELEASDLLEQLAAMPWACLRTGAHERQCLKDVGLTAPEPDSVDPGDPGPSDPPSADEPADEPSTAAGDPPLPVDCDPLSWEPYFCQLATAKYRQGGVDIAFPCEIFDALAPFASTLDEVPPQGSGDPSLPSCHDGEWGLREQSWLDAVMHGCLALDAPILTMCQQASNYAPNSGACNPTGTW